MFSAMSKPSKKAQRSSCNETFQFWKRCVLTNFRTKDVDNDFDASENCASKWTGGWWFRNCGDYVNLNGGYFRGGSAPYGKGNC